MNIYHITYVSSSFLVGVWVVWFGGFFTLTGTFPFILRIGSWPVEVLNPNIYQYTIYAFKSSFLLFWKRHCSHLSLEIVKNVGPESRVLCAGKLLLETFNWGIFLHFSFSLSPSQIEVLRHSSCTFSFPSPMQNNCQGRCELSSTVITSNFFFLSDRVFHMKILGVLLPKSYITVWSPGLQ